MLKRRDVDTINFCFSFAMTPSELPSFLRSSVYTAQSEEPKVKAQQSMVYRVSRSCDLHGAQMERISPSTNAV